MSKSSASCSEIFLAAESLTLPSSFAVSMEVSSVDPDLQRTLRKACPGCAGDVKYSFSSHSWAFSSTSLLCCFAFHSRGDRFDHAACCCLPPAFLDFFGEPLLMAIVGERRGVWCCSRLFQEVALERCLFS